MSSDLIGEAQANADATRRELTIQPPPKRPWIENPAVPFGEALPARDPDPIGYAPTSEQQPQPPLMGATEGLPFGDEIPSTTIGFAPTSEQQPTPPNLSQATPPSTFGDDLPSPITHSTQGGMLDDLFTSRTGQALVPGMQPGRNIAEEVMAPYKLQAQADAQRQGEFVDSFLGSRDSIIDRNYATSNTGVGQSMLMLGESLTASNARRLEGAASIASLGTGQSWAESRGEQIANMPSPPDSLNNPIGEIAPGAAAPEVQTGASAWYSSITGQASAVANLVGSLFTPLDGKFDSITDLPDVLFGAPFKFGAAIGRNVSGTRGRADTSQGEAIDVAATALGQSIAPAENINGGYIMNPADGRFGAQGSGLGGAALYGFSIFQNLVGASIYSITDAGAVANQALIGLPIVGESIRQVTNNFGSDLVNRPELQQLGYRYYQAFGGADLSFTQDRDTLQSKQSNAYLNILDPKAEGGAWWARFGVGMALDLFTGGVDDIVRIGVRGAPVGRVAIPYPSLRTSIARIGRPGRTPTGLRIPFVETTEQVASRTAREARRAAVAPTLGTDINGVPDPWTTPESPATVIQPPNYGRGGQPGVGRVVEPPTEPDPWGQSPPSQTATPHSVAQPTAIVAQGEAVFSNGTDALAVSIITNPGLMPPRALNQRMIDADMAAFNEQVYAQPLDGSQPLLGTDSQVDADMAAFNPQVYAQVIPEDSGTYLPSQSPTRLLPGQASLPGQELLPGQEMLPGQELLPGQMEQPQLPAGAERTLITPEPSSGQTIITPAPRVVEPEIPVTLKPKPPEASTPPTTVIPVTPEQTMLRAVANDPTSLEAANPVVRAAVVKESIDSQILDDVGGGEFQYTDATVREQNRMVRRLERQVENLKIKEQSARQRRLDTTPIAKERIALQSQIEDAKFEIGKMRQSMPEDKALLDTASPVVTAVDMRPGMTLDAYLGSTQRDITSRDMAQVPRTLKDLTALGKFLTGNDGKPIVSLTRKRPLDTSELKKLRSMYGFVFDKVGKPIPQAVLEANPLMRVETAVDSSQIPTKTAFVQTPEARQPAVTVTQQAPDPRFADKEYAAPGSPQAITEVMKAREQARADFMSSQSEEASHALDDLSTEPGSAVAVEEFAQNAPTHLKPTEPGTKKQASKMLKARAKVHESGQIASELEDKIAFAQAALVQDTKELQRVVGDGRAVVADEVLTHRVMGVEPKKAPPAGYTPYDVSEAVSLLQYEAYQNKKPFDFTKLQEYAQDIASGKREPVGISPDTPFPIVREDPEFLATVPYAQIMAKAGELGGIPLDQPFAQIFHQVQDRVLKSSTGTAENPSNFIYYDRIEDIPTPVSLPEALAYLRNTKKISDVQLTPKFRKAAEKTAQEVNKVTWYHGTRVGMDDVTNMHPNAGSSSNLDMGAGLYLTPDPQVGGLYARAAKHTESAVDQLIEHSPTGNLHEVVVNLDRVVLSSDVIPKPILDQLKQVMGLSKLTKASTFADIWKELKDSGVSALTYQNLSAEVATILKGSGLDGIQRDIGLKKSSMAGDLLVLDTLDGSPLPANTTTKTEGFGTPDSLDSKIARHQVDSMMDELDSTKHTKANELQSRLQVEGQHLQDLSEQYAKTLRQAETEVGDYVKQSEVLAEMVERQRRIVEGIQQEQAPTIAQRQAKNKIEATRTNRDSPCL